jgi:hypothetical protein
MYISTHQYLLAIMAFRAVKIMTYQTLSKALQAQLHDLEIFRQYH